MQVFETKGALETQHISLSPTKLYTLSGLRLEQTNFTRPKPLLLLAYLCLEGKQEKRFLAELFWQGASNHLNSLAKALSQLRQVGVIDNDDTHAWATVSSDITEFFEALERKDFALAVTLYRSSFLSGFYLPDWGVEVEEWVYSTREYLATRMREALLELAETSSDATTAMKYAERAYELTATLEPDLIPRLYKFLANTPHATKLKREAEEFGVSLEQTKTITSNLPVRGTSFIGRDIERLELGELLSQSDVRLLTIVGQGGVGKTRLALEVVREAKEDFRDGVVFIPLESFTTHEQAISSFSTIFGVALDTCDDVVKLSEAIGDKQLLILLDNFEHLLEMSPRLSQLLRECRNLKILITSRARLELEEEWLYRLGGFSLPEEMSLETAQLNDAVTLFVQRARKVKQGFALTQECLPFVFEICKRVEGLPLGIELAASWAKTLSCGEIAENLEDLDFLTTSLNNVSERQQSLRGVFEGSWNLLSNEEQNVLSKLSVFRGGFTSEAAREVAGASLMMLARLVDKSLLRVSEGRYDQHLLLRSFAEEKLATLAGTRTTSMSHAHYFLVQAECARVHLRSGAAGAWLKQLDIEFANINMALTRLQSPDTASLAMRLIGVLSYFWESQNYLSEGRKWARETLKLAGSTASSECAQLLLVAGNLAWLQGDSQEATTLYQDSLRLWRTLNNKEGEGKVLNNIALIAWQKGNYDDAKETYELCLEICRSVNDVTGVGNATLNLGNLYFDLGEFDKAQPLYQKSLGIYQLLENKRLMGASLIGLAALAYEGQDYETAQHYAREGLQMMREVAYKIGEADTLNLLGEIKRRLGDHTLARTYLREALEMQRDINEKPGIALSLESFGRLELAEDNAHKAVGLWAAALSIREMTNIPIPPRSQKRHEGQLLNARHVLGETAFNTAWTKGRLLTLEQAINFALQSEV